jgi:hypothetical protein
MDAGDLDGDGRVEMVAVTRNKVMVYRKDHQALKAVATFDGQGVDRFMWVCVADMSREGKGYIYVTNLRKRNSSKGQGDSRYGNADQREELLSFVLALEGDKLKVVASNVSYFLNTVYLGQRGKVLVGQQRGDITVGPFKGDIMEMQLRGSSLDPITPLNVPKRCNVFNFAKADINNDKMEEIVLFDDSHNLLILNPAGEQIWKGNSIFGATTNSFEGKVEDRRYNLIDLVSIPSPIIVTDLNKDGIPEIILNRNTTSLEKFLPDSMKYYDKGEVVSLSWDQLGLVENWKTREVNGMITGIRVGDLNGDGTSELLISLVLAKDFLKLSDSKSTIFSYDLNVAPAKSVAAKQ